MKGKMEYMAKGRVEENTPSHINEKINMEIQQRLMIYARRDRSAISKRIKELEEEWDIERILELNAASFSLLGAVMGVFVNRKWLFLTGAVAAFLIQHAVQGWCPPISLFRRLGVRTKAEIEREKNALKALRGDFAGLDEISDYGMKAEHALASVM
jgi:hypothetical protein